MPDLEIKPDGSTSYLGQGHQLSIVKSGNQHKGWCSAEDWSAIGSTKGEVKERWSQHLYGVMQKRGEGEGAKAVGTGSPTPTVGLPSPPGSEPEIVPE